VFFIFTDDIHGMISTPSVNNDVFEVWIILLKNRLYGFFQEFGLVIGRGDDSNFWKFVLHFDFFLSERSKSIET